MMLKKMKLHKQAVKVSETALAFAGRCKTETDFNDDFRADIKRLRRELLNLEHAIVLEEKKHKK